MTVKTRVTASEYELLLEQARREDRSLASLLRQLIRDRLNGATK